MLRAELPSPCPSAESVFSIYTALERSGRAPSSSGCGGGIEAGTRWEYSSREEIWFVEETEKQPMEIEGGGRGSPEALGRGKKRPLSPGGDEGPAKSDSDDDEWCVSDSDSDTDSDEVGDDNPSQGMYCPFTINNFPRASCDYDMQTDVVYVNPEIRLRGPSPIRLFPAFKTGEHMFGSDYNLDDKSEISLTDVEDCLNECCCYSMILLQFVDVKIAGYHHKHPCRAKIFGFITARDKIKPLRNYVYRRVIDDCEAVSVKRKTGVARLSLMSPTRVISMGSRAFIEFELYAQSEDERNSDDAPIIEGCTELYNMMESKSFIQHRRLYGETCALDIKYMVLFRAVEARVEIKVLRIGAIDGGANMKLLAKTSGFGEVIRLFRGTAPKLDVMMSFAIAVERHSGFDLYIEGYSRDDPILGQKQRTCSRWQCGFTADYHGTDEEVAELGKFGAVSVKVTWRSYKKL